MKFKDYIALKGIEKKQVAAELKITRGYVYDLVYGKHKPGRKLATRIIEWSQGAVRYEDLWG